MDNRRFYMALRLLIYSVVLICLGCDNNPGPPQFLAKKGAGQNIESATLSAGRAKTSAEETSPKDVWVNKASHDGQLGRITFMVVNPHDPSVVYAGARSGGLIRILNRADGWSSAGNVQIATQYSFAISASDQSMGLDAGEVTSFAVHPKHAASFLVGMGGIFKSTDAGQAWTQVFNRPPVNSIVFDPKDPDNTFAAGGSSGYFRSTDGGETWTEAGNDLRYVYCLLIDPDNTSTMYAGAYSAVYKSTDKGVSWMRILDAAVPSMAIVPDTDLVKNDLKPTVYFGHKYQI